MGGKRQDRMHLGAFFMSTGHHIAAWRHPEAQIDAAVNMRHWVECARIAERAGFDFLFLADSPAVRDAPMEPMSRSSQYIAYLEPLTLLSALAMTTEKIGLVATGTTSFDAPYNTARKFASLDIISGGRAGWNIVTTGNRTAAMNFGLDKHYEHDDRYRRAREFVEVAKGLWDSWDDDAFVHDRESGRFFDPTRLHTLNHVGEYFKVKGPLNIPRSPQGYPVMFQAGTSDPGKELAAATADGVFTSSLTLPEAQGHYADAKRRMPKYGREPDHMKILPGCTVTCAATAAEAREKEEYLASLVHPVVGVAYIEWLTAMDLSDCDPDGPMPDRPSTKPESGVPKSIKALAKDENLTIRQLYQRLAGAMGKVSFLGSVMEVADTMQAWFESRACDGFIIQPSTMPGNLDDVANLLVPELQNRGLIRVGYEGATLRDHMGLPRPASQYARPRGR